MFAKYFDQTGYKYAYTTTTDGTEHDAFAVRSGVAYGKEITPNKKIWISSYFKVARIII